MSNDLVGCEWVSVFSGTGLPGLSRTKAVYVCVLQNIAEMKLMVALNDLISYNLTVV